MPLSACAPGSANCPEYGRIRPILIVCWAHADEEATTPATTPTRIHRIATSPCCTDRKETITDPRPGDSQLAAARPRRILDVLDLVERHIDELAADLLDLADVDRLHDVAGLGVDRHHPARALPLQALGRRNQGVTVGLAA